VDIGHDSQVFEDEGQPGGAFQLAQGIRLNLVGVGPDFDRTSVGSMEEHLLSSLFQPNLTLMSPEKIKSV